LADAFIYIYIEEEEEEEEVVLGSVFGKLSCHDIEYFLESTYFLS
jgi:hypothetical protein